jgi:preprotein translocase subunit SecB
MNAAPLQLRAYVAEQIHLDLAPGFDQPDAPEPQGTDTFDVQIEVIERARAGQVGDLRLTVLLNESAEAWRFYRVRLVLRGVFDLHDDSPPPDDELDRYFVLTAATVLYGAARALCSQLTAASPYPPLVLPVVTFADEIDALLAPPAPASPKKRTPRKPPR